MKTSATTPSIVDCLICATPLEYAEQPRLMTCGVCGREQETLIWCPHGHFVCDACHGKSALEALTTIAAASSSTDPGAVLEAAMAHPAVAMHGPEHHAFVPAAIVTAYHNTIAVRSGTPGDQVRAADLEKAIQRGQGIPGGWCGYFGACGAAIGAGIAVSVIAGATPLKGQERTLAMAATAAALERLLDGEARCCKRASRTAVAAAVDFLRDRLDIELTPPAAVACTYAARNRQCPGARCPYYPEP